MRAKTFGSMSCMHALCTEERAWSDIRWTGYIADLSACLCCINVRLGTSTFFLGDQTSLAAS
jgi:hypothetical protein